MFTASHTNPGEPKLPPQSPKLVDQVRHVLRVKHYARRTEESYVNWIKRYLKFYNLERHPKDMDRPEIEAFLTHLAVSEHVAPSTQNQASPHR